MNFEGFTSVDFQPASSDVPGFVYVLFWKTNTEEVPFYVGQTKRIWGRLDDYYWAMFSACTDFRVGEAVKYLYQKGFSVSLKYKPSENPRVEERQIIEELKPSCRLLNFEAAFNYQTADETMERERVQAFLNGLLPPSIAQD